MEEKKLLQPAGWAAGCTAGCAGAAHASGAGRAGAGKRARRGGPSKHFQKTYSAVSKCTL